MEIITITNRKHCLNQCKYPSFVLYPKSHTTGLNAKFLCTNKGEYMKEPVYVTHLCKNSKLTPIQSGKNIPTINHEKYCFKAFVDLDKYGANSTTLATWKYCPECESKGFKNPKTRVAKEPSEKQLLCREMFKKQVAERHRLAKEAKNNNNG